MRLSNKIFFYFFFILTQLMSVRFFYNFSLTKNNPEFYFLSELPSELKFSDVLMVGTISMAMSFLSTIYPSYRAIARDPVEALRNE